MDIKNNYIKNDLEEFRNGFAKIKSLLSFKRNPEDKIDSILEKIRDEGSENQNFNKSITKRFIDDGKKLFEKENKIAQNESNKNSRKFKIENEKSKNCHRFRKTENKNLDCYFDKKDSNQEKINKNNTNTIIINGFFINQTNLLPNQLINKSINYYQSLNIIKINEEINKNQNFYIQSNRVKYNYTFINSIYDIPKAIKEFYLINSNTINKSNKNEYFSKLKNYFNSLNNIKQKYDINIGNKKLIFIHDSFSQIKRIPKIMSNIINPRNCLVKDEYLIDYEKDSEDEYLEENAEDIKSDENEDIEEDDEETVNYQKDGGFIVSDGHLSEDELSDEDLLEERKKLKNSKNKLLDIKFLFNIRKNYIRPVLIDFKNKKNERVSILENQLTIGLFNYENIFNINNFDNNSYINEDSFPIKIDKNSKKYKGIQDSIRNHFKDIVKKVHGSYDTKDHLIFELNKKFEDLPKKVLNNFFRENCLKIPKKYWVIRTEILEQFNLDKNEIKEIKNKNHKIYKEKEEKKVKELEEIKIENGVINGNKQKNIDMENFKGIEIIGNERDISKSKKLKEIIIGPKEYNKNDVSFEIKSENYNSDSDRHTDSEIININDSEEILTISLEDLEEDIKYLKSNNQNGSDEESNSVYLEINENVGRKKSKNNSNIKCNKNKSKRKKQKRK